MNPLNPEKALSVAQQLWVEQTLSSLSMKDKIGHLLMPWLRDDDTEKWGAMIREYHLGSVFISPRAATKTRSFIAALQEQAAIPLLVAADMEQGYACEETPSEFDLRLSFPYQLACGSANRSDLMEVKGQALARNARSVGIHWTFSPSIDLLVNLNNPETNVRALSENPQVVDTLARSYLRGVQGDGLLAATCKHFPGAGVDDRDQHLCTSIMPYSVDQWEESYGKVWRSLIASGVATIMPGHIAFPAWENLSHAPLSALPATLSYSQMNDLLREKLGFKGLIVSDAAPMVGLASRVVKPRMALEFILAGGDTYLFSEPEQDFPALLAAVKSGELTEERVDASVRRILELKARLELFVVQTILPPTDHERAAWKKAAADIAEDAICLHRNDGALPVDLAPGARVATITIFWKEAGQRCPPLTAVDEELQARGYEVEHFDNPDHEALARIAGEFDKVFVNIESIGHSIMGVTRLIGHMAMSFWRGFWTDHPGKVVFTSFGSPGVFYEMPHLPNMLSAFSPDLHMQRAAVRVWMGETTAHSRSPVHIPYITEGDGAQTPKVLGQSNLPAEIKAE